MTEDDGVPVGAPTRREYVKIGGAAVGGVLLAGCLSGNDDGGTDDGQAGDGETGDAEPNGNDSASDGGTGDGDASESGPYSVSMEPVGTVEFDEVPETWFPYTGDYADMGVALGQADGLSAIGVKARFGTHHYEELPGVSVDKSGLTELWQGGTGKEIFYELDADVHVIDPNFMINRIGWDQGDVEEIGDGVGPFFGNTIFSRAYGWHDDYAYYSLYEAFEKLAELFQEQERFEAFRSYHDEVLADVQARLPDETPSVAILYPAEVPPDAFYPYLIGDGAQSKHWNDLGVECALTQAGVTDAQAGGGTLDYEGLIEIDPDVIAIRLQGEVTQSYIDEEITSHMQDHDLASQLTAVENDRVVYGGLTYQGPIIHLFQLEQAAKGLYPGEFGEVGGGEQLFDREEVADVVNGGF
ncbi:ABC transporter substrate-binding protein [Salinarchaeum chitinilyticum]